MLQSICVFCGANAGRNPMYAESARRVGQLLAESSLTLVYGGGRVGMMGVLAESALAHGGRVIGVIPRHLMELEMYHTGLSELHVVESMHVRKQLMCDLADGFLTLPGGFGTLDELCEIMTWNQLGTITKTTALLNVGGYYDHFLRGLDHAVAEGFLRPENRQLLLTDTDEASLLQQMRTYQPITVKTWITEAER